MRQGPRRREGGLQGIGVRGLARCPDLPLSGGRSRTQQRLGDRKLALQICVDLIPHPGQSASVESLVRALLEIFVGGETAMTMHQPRC